MHTSFILVTLLSVFITLCYTSPHTKDGAAKWVPNFPNVKRIPKSWSFESTNNKNVSFTEYYYWMENANETDKDLQKFKTDQTVLTESYMRQCNDRSAIKQSIIDASNYDNLGNLGLWGEENGNPLYVYNFQKSGETHPTWFLATPKEFQDGQKNHFNHPVGKPFLNESLLSSDDSAVILSYTLSPDAKIFGYLVYTTSDLGTWYWRSTESPLITAKTTPEGGEGRLPLTIPFCSFLDSFFWKSDGSGFFYIQSQDSQGGTILDHAEKVRYHKWGSEYGEDVTVFDAHKLGKDGDVSYLIAFLSDDDRWLIVSSYPNTDAKVRTYATSLANQSLSQNMKWICLAPDNDFQMWYITVIDDWFYFQTDDQANNSKVAKVHLDFSRAKTVKLFNELQDRPKFTDVIPERKNASIPRLGTFVYPIANHKCIVVYVETGQYTLSLFDLISGQFLQRILPEEKMYFSTLGSTSTSKKAFLPFSSFDTPLKVYELELNDQDRIDATVISVQNIAGTTSDDFEVEQFFATSKDGAQIPYFVTSRKGTPKDGTRPVFMHAYAAYGQVDNLFYEPSYFTWLNSYGGFFCFCGARGGGDEGGSWHSAAEGVNKHRTSDDIIACVEDVIKRKITSEGLIILEGGSAGALAQAAVLNQIQSGLVGAALLVHGEYDLFEFELRSTIGANNVLEFGSVSDPNQVQAVLDWSPYQNINPNKSYPAVLVQIGEEDVTTPASLGYKYVAQLQYSHQHSSNPLLMYSNQQEGHFSDIGTSEAIASEATYQLCITQLALGIERRTK